MKQMLIPLTIFLASVSAWAGSGSLLGIALPDHDPVVVFLRQQADYVAMPVTISSDHRDPVQRLAGIAAAKRLIQKKAEENPDIIVNTGQVTLSREPPGTGTRMGTSGPVSAVRLNILVPFKGKGKRRVRVCNHDLQVSRRHSHAGKGGYTGWRDTTRCGQSGAVSARPSKDDRGRLR